MTSFVSSRVLVGFGLLLCLSACSQPPASAPNAASSQPAQRQVPTVAQEKEKFRQELEKIPPPTKSRYIDVHSIESWENPFLSVGVNTIKMRVIMADANPSTVGQGGMLRPQSARRQELEIRIPDLTKALTSLPASAWPYGRVIAVAETATTEKKQRPQIRRNVELVIQQLTDLGVVVDEWPVK